MPMQSFFDLLNPVDVQQAVAATRVEQQAKHLAVQPRPVLEPLVLKGLRMKQAGEQLRLGERRTALEEARLRFQHRMAPFAIGLGALDLGVNLLGGFRALQVQREQAQQAGILEQLRARGLATQERQTAALEDIFAARRRQALAPAGSGL